MTNNEYGIITGILEKMAKTFDLNQTHCNNGDAERSVFTSGEFCGYCSILRMVGLTVETGGWQDGAVTRISLLEINGCEIISFHKWHQAGYNNLIAWLESMIDEEPAG